MGGDGGGYHLLLRDQAMTDIGGKHGDMGGPAGAGVEIAPFGIGAAHQRREGR